MTQWLATTVYDRTNDTVLQVLDMTDPLPTNYSAEDFLKVFDLALEVDFVPGYQNSTQYQNLEYLAVWFVPSATYDVDYSKLLQLNQFIATPIQVLNYQFLQTPGIPLIVPPENLNKTGDLVKPRYQVRAFRIGLTLGANLTCLILLLCRGFSRISPMVCCRPRGLYLGGAIADQHTVP